jgi:hypothetical protein
LLIVTINTTNEPKRSIKLNGRLSQSERRHKKFAVPLSSNSPAIVACNNRADLPPVPADSDWMTHIFPPT